MEELVQLGKRDPIRRNVESGVDTEGLSPMDPPDAYSPTKVEGVDYNDLHPYLQTLIEEHAPIKEAVDARERARAHQGTRRFAGDKRRDIEVL